MKNPPNAVNKAATHPFLETQPKLDVLIKHGSEINLYHRTSVEKSGIFLSCLNTCSDVFVIVWTEGGVNSRLDHVG